MNILAIGDVVSDKGCEFLRARLPGLKKLKNIDFTIVNGENSAVGNGITPASAKHIFDSGADIITTGNHVYRHKEFYGFLDERPDIIRPANYHAENPGRGFAVSDLGYTQVAVINLAGRVYMDACDNPFDAADSILGKINCKTVIVDFHAEATAEKAALAYYLAGRVSAVFGTHTHVPTADAKILPGGTGFITDIGMTGVKDSVIGVAPQISVQYLRTGMPARFDAADGACVMGGCIFETDNKTGRCLSIEQIIIE